MLVLDKRSELTAQATPRPRSPLSPGPAIVVGIALGAFILRVLFIEQQSAYMDENTNILIGRYLIERHAVYADALNWSYGSYLWALLAGAADMLGGLTLVRTVTALLGAIMTLATGITAAALTPAMAGPTRRWIVGGLAALIMAIYPTAIGVGRFASYDALAGAAFMLGIAILLIARQRGNWWLLPLAALGLFIAFLAKYVVAIFFPFVCLYLLLSPRTRTALARNLAGFVLPLAAACVLYFLFFREQLTILLSFSTEYVDLASATPLHEYVLQRPEVWVLAALAAFGWREAAWVTRFFTGCGAAIIAAFQLYSRADFDFWKHSIYVIFFLAPLAATALLPPTERVFALGVRWLGPASRHPFVVALATVVLGALVGTALFLGAGALEARAELDTVIRRASFVLVVIAIVALALAPVLEMRRVGVGSRRRLQALLTVLLAILMVGVLAAPALAESSRLVTFYPNLNPSLPAIGMYTAQARTVLTDDSAVRYYLYPHLAAEQVTDPFFIDYNNGHQGDAGYRLAIGGRYFDRIVLTGGIGPTGGEFKNRYGQLITDNYEQIYINDSGYGAPVRIFKPRETDLMPPDPRSTVFHFDADAQGWGARTNGTGLQPGASVTVDRNRIWNGHAPLRFTPTADVSAIGVRPTGPVSKVVAWVYVEGDLLTAPDTRIGMTGFDATWQWHDDAFEQTVPAGRWSRITWNLSAPGQYNEIGLAFPDAAGRTIFIGQVELQP